MVSLLFVLSICKPTETYGIVNKPDDLINLTCNVTKGEIEEFKANCYQREGVGIYSMLRQVKWNKDKALF
ncbi:hypothetical protein DIU36_17790 [Mucilaginibacter rubeus]|nr:hypothetical protein DIU36_17790 [Mucilaginibacter rubeus]